MARGIILTSQKWNDIVFENKPKDYGAYEMRQTSSRRHIAAFLVTVALVVFVAFLPKLMETVRNLRPAVDGITEDTALADLRTLEDEIKKQDQLVQDNTPPPPPLKSTIQFVAPVIVDDDEMEEDQMLKSQDELQDSKAQVSVFDVEGTDDEFGVDKAELEEHRTVAEDTDDKIYEVVEQMPEFPGGYSELLKFLNANIRYPAIASENGIQGRVSVRFTVSKDGSISNITVLQGPDKSLNDEAVRLVKSMPKWIPGKYNGRTVNVNFNLPVVFRLE